MSYVPIVPSAPSPPPSPRTRELAALLTKVLDEYKKSHPAATDAEIRAAVRLAQISSRSGRQSATAMLSLGVGLGLAALLGGVFLLVANAGGDWEAVTPMVIMGVVVFIAILAVLVKTASR